MRNRHLLLKAAIAGIFALCLQCAQSPLAGGNSSQTGSSGVSVSAGGQSIFGTTVAGARVAIYEQSYKPYMTPAGTSDSTVADDSGHFSFSYVGTGTYNLLVIDTGHGSKSAFVPGIPVFPDIQFSRSFDSLAQQGYVSGSAADHSGAIYSFSYVFINGTPFYTVTKNNGDFLLGPLPPGKYETGLFAISGIDTTKPNMATQVWGSVRTTSEVIVASDSVTVWHW